MGAGAFRSGAPQPTREEKVEVVAVLGAPEMLPHKVQTWEEFHEESMGGRFSTMKIEPSNVCHDLTIRPSKISGFYSDKNGM